MTEWVLGPNAPPCAHFDEHGYYCEPDPYYPTVTVFLWPETNPWRTAVDAGRIIPKPAMFELADDLDRPWGVFDRLGSIASRYSTLDQAQTGVAKAQVTGVYPPYTVRPIGKAVAP